ncbi:MAG TPA: hypothetical protein VGI66_08175 [Streptosporangiaceae bacterium]
MTKFRRALVAAGSAGVLGLSVSPAFAGTTSSAGTVISGTAGASTALCLAHVPGGLGADWYDAYTPGCTGHDEPELDPLSTASRSAQNVTWHVQLPADGTSTVSSVGPTFWFGGTVRDPNPHKIGQEGFLELQFYPDSFTKNCGSTGSFNVVQDPNVYTACSPVWTLAKKGQTIAEPAAFNGMLTDASGKAPFVMHALDIVDVHIWAPGPSSAYQEQVADETSGQTSSVLVLISPKDGPLTPEYSTQEIGNALDWGGVWDTPMAFVWEIGHSDLYGSTPGAFCIPGQTNCGSFNAANWAGFTPIRIFNVTFGDASQEQGWAAVSDTGGKAEVLGNSFVGPTDCTGYGGPFCTYPYFSSDGAAINFGAGPSNLGGVDQFAQTALCPSTGVFAGATYCDTVLP